MTARTLQDLWTLLSIVAVLVTVAIVAFRSAQRSERDFTNDNPRQLFRELCGAHKLPFASRRLLKRLASARGLAEPALLFVDSGYFETSNLPVDLQRSAAEIRSLRDRLFR
jgi:hypothetical protein